MRKPLVLFIIFLAGCAGVDPSLSSAAAGDEFKASASQPCRDPRRNRDREEVCRLSNLNRRSKLVLDARLSRIAQGHAETMRRTGQFGHEFPGGGTLKSRLEAGRAEYKTAGENIAQGQREASEVVEGWMDSSSHRENIQNRAFGRLGVGRSGDYWVQVFTD